MAQRCSICTHPARFEIDKSLIDGVAKRTIADQFGVSGTAVQRHKSSHLAELLADHATGPAPARQPAQAAHDPTRAVRAHAEQRAVAEGDHALDILAQLGRQIERVSLLSDATDRWLRDPDDPSRYDIGARAENVTVVYTVEIADDAPPVRRKASLQELVDRIESTMSGVSIVSTESKYADPRELLLKASDSMKGQMQMALAIAERLHSAQEVETFMATVLDAIAEEAPDARARIDDNIRRRRARHGLPLSAIR